MTLSHFSNIDAVILDFDGVVVDSEPISLGELQKSLADHGIEMNWKEMVKSFLGSNPRTISNYMLEATGRDPSPVFPGPWHERVTAGFARNLPVIDGTLPLLNALDEHNIPYCLASGSSIERLAFALDLIGQRERFEGRAFSTELVAHGKPAPDIFLHAAENLGVRPEACMVIEDGVAGTVGAKAAGVQSIIGFVGASHLEDTELRDDHARTLSANGATRIVHRLSDLLSQ